MEIAFWAVFLALTIVLIPLFKASISGPTTMTKETITMNKLHFSDGWIYFLQSQEGEEDETPILMGHEVPTPSDTATLSADDFQQIGSDWPNFQEIVQALSE